MGGMFRCKAVVVFSFEGNKNCVRIERMNPSSTPSSLDVHIGVCSLLGDLRTAKEAVWLHPVERCGCDREQFCCRLSAAGRIGRHRGVGGDGGWLG